MTIAFRCPCGTSLRVAPESAGKAVKCPKCGKALRVPAPRAATPTAGDGKSPARSAPPRQSGSVKPSASPARNPAPPTPPRPKRAADIDDSPADVVLPADDEDQDDDRPARRSSHGEWEVPDALRDRLDEELERGEKVIWAGKPSAMLRAVGPLVFAAVGLLVALFLLTPLIDLILYAFGAPNVTWKYLVVFGILLGVFFGVTVKPLWTWLGTARTDYVLTDRRAIVWKPGFFGLISKDEYGPDDLQNIRRRRAWFFGDGAGCVVFRSVTIITNYYRGGRYEGSSRNTTYYGFLKVRRADAVYDLVYETLTSRERRRRNGPLSPNALDALERLREEDARAPERRKKEGLFLALGSVAASLVMFAACGGGALGLMLDVGSGNSPFANNGETKSGDSQWSVDRAVKDLADANHDVRKKAAEALTNPKTIPVEDGRKPEVARQLEQAIRDTKDQREIEGCVKALGVWGTTESADTLIGLLATGDAGVCNEAASLLGKGKVAKASEALAALLPDGAKRKSASQALEAIGPPAEAAVVKSLNHPDNNVRQEARRLLKAWDTRDAVLIPQALADLNSGNLATKTSALGWFAAVKSPDPGQQAQVAGALAALLTDGNDAVREAAARGLKVWATADNVPAIAAALGDKKDQVKGDLHEVLLRLKDPRAAPALAGVLEKDAKWRGKAQEELIAIGPPSEPAVVSLLENKDTAVRAAVCKILAAVGTKDSVEPLKKLSAEKSIPANLKKLADDAIKAIEGRK